MRNYFSSTAVFSPPDELGTGSEHAPVLVPEGQEAASVSEPSPTGSGDAGTPDKPRKETIRESVQRAFKETKDRAAGIESKAKQSPQKDGAAPATAAKPAPTAQTDGNTEPAPQAKAGAPASWKAEEKALWDSLPETARAAITRREADATKGVQELRSRYTEIDTAIAPYSAVMRQNNVTPGQAIGQLFKWNMELAGPNKVQAARALLQNFNIDPATLAADPGTGTQPGADPTANQIPENLRPIITGLESRIKSFEEQSSLAAQTAAQQTWANWSKDKPHAETVRGLMANLINSDLSLIQAGQPQVSNTIQNGSIDMDAAYQAAIYAHPEVRTAVLQEEQAKRDAAAKAAAEKARRAGTSLRSGAPAGAVNGNAAGAPKSESPRESIRRALNELRGTQH